MRTNLQTRLLAITLLPILIGSMAGGYFYLHARFQELSGMVLSQHELQAEHIRLVLLAGRDDLQQLNALLDESMNDVALDSMTVHDLQGNVLAHRGHPDIALNPQQNNQQHILKNGEDIWILALNHPGEPRRTRNGDPAWIQMDFSMTPLLLQQYQSIFEIGFIIVCWLGCSLIWVMGQTRQLIRPLRRMIDKSSRLRGGHFELRFPNQNLIELDQLSNSFNLMLETIQTEVEDLRQTMLQTHEDLQSTLESMEVQNIELSLARKEAVEGNRIKSEFLTNISHEIRTPLNSILGFTQILSRSNLSERHMDYIQTIQKSAHNLLAMINDLLDLSKIEARKLQLDHIPLNIEDCIYDVLTMLAPLAETKALNLISLIYDDVPLNWLGDPLRLKQILTNLISNAIKFTEQGDVTIRVFLDDHDQHEHMLRFTIQDTGIGLAEHVRSELFRAFSQGDASTNRKYGGSGLGLVISKHLVEQMGGDIGFDSELGLGSTFWFTVLLEIDPSPEVPQAQMLCSRIGLIMSHPGLTQMWMHQLQRWSHSVQHWPAIEALDPVQAQTCDVIGIHLPQDQSLTQTQKDFLLLLQRPLLILCSSQMHDTGLWPDTAHRPPHLSIPVAPSRIEQELANLLHPNPNTQRVASTRFDNCHVLVVDDHPANRKLVAALMSDLGIYALTAADANSAMQILKKQSVDLIFMDVQMPGMDGIELTRTIRQKFPDRPVPIIALTAHAMPDERDSLLKAGMNDYMSKPLQEPALIRILNQWLDLKLVPVNTPVDESSSPTAPKDLPLIDWALGYRIAGGKKDLAESMIEGMLKHVSADIAFLESHLDTPERTTLLERVHYIHGASRYCGLPRLSAQADTLERTLKQQNQGVINELELIRQQLTDFISTLKQLQDWHNNRTPHEQDSIHDTHAPS